MKLLKPKSEIIFQEPTLEGVFKQIEIAGRTCYKSEDKITPESAEKFVQRMINSKHFAMLEHGTIYLAIPAHFNPYISKLQGVGEKYIHNSYSKVSGNKTYNKHYVTTNYRVLIENNWLDDLKYLSNPTKYHEKRISVKFSTQIATTREFNRHRVNSIAEQSTRYCNYSSDKFNNGLSISIPSWVNQESSEITDCEYSLEYFCKNVLDNSYNWSALEYWLFANLVSEYSYLNLINMGKSPQEARAILPLDLQTELIHTAFISDWQHFFDLRALGTTGKPHPDAEILAKPLLEEFKLLKLL